MSHECVSSVRVCHIQCATNGLRFTYTGTKMFAVGFMCVKSTVCTKVQSPSTLCNVRTAMVIVEMSGLLCR